MRKARSIKASDKEWAAMREGAKADGFESVAAWLRWLAEKRRQEQERERR